MGFYHEFPVAYFRAFWQLTSRHRELRPRAPGFGPSVLLRLLPDFQLSRFSHFRLLLILSHCRRLDARAQSRPRGPRDQLLLLLGMAV